MEGLCLETIRTGDVMKVFSASDKIAFKITAQIVGAILILALLVAALFDSSQLRAFMERPIGEQNTFSILFAIWIIGWMRA